MMTIQDNPTGRANSNGAAYIGFYEKDQALALELKLLNSPEAYRNLLAEIPASAAQAAKALLVNGTNVQTDIKFVAATNLRRWTLAFQPVDNKLVGEINPTYNLARKNWNIAKVDMPCEEVAAVK